MPFMIQIRKAVVFAGERGEGLQKVEKLSIYADQVLVIPEKHCDYQEILFPAGPIVHGTEILEFSSAKTAKVQAKIANKNNYKQAIKGADFVCSDLLDRKLNQKIFAYCKKKGIRCNVIDTKDLCDTWFMSLIDVPGMLVGISSKGGCAYYSKQSRQELHEQIRARGQMSLALVEVKEFIKQANNKMDGPTLGLSVIPTLAKVYNDQTFRNFMAREQNQDALEYARSIVAAPTGGQ